MSLKIKKIISFLFLTIPLFLKAVSVFADDKLPKIATSAPETIVSREGLKGLIHIINKTRGAIYGMIILIGILFILFSAFTIITSGGNEKKLEKGKKMLQATIIGIVVAMLSVSIILITISILDV